MEDLNMNKLNESELSAVDGGTASASGVKARPIKPIWVEVTASSLNCRYTPNGEIAKVYERGHRLKVTADIHPTARSPRSTREATGSKSMASPLTASGTDF